MIDMYPGRFGGYGIIQRVDDVPAELSAWQARATAHQGRPIRIHHNASAAKPYAWMVLDVAPKCSPLNMAYIGRDLTLSEVRRGGGGGGGGSGGGGLRVDEDPFLSHRRGR
jgi:hypothetical protein